MTFFFCSTLFFVSIAANMTYISQAYLLMNSSGDEVLAHTIVLACYLLGMAMSTLMASRNFFKKTIEKFFGVELAILVCIFLIFCLGQVFLIYNSSVYAIDRAFWNYLYFAITTIILGVAVGLEFPIIEQVSKFTFGSVATVNRLLAFNYFGLLVGSLLASLYFLKNTNLMVMVGTAILAAQSLLVIFVGHIYFFNKQIKIKNTFILSYIGISGVLATITIFALGFYPQIEQFYLKTKYADFELVEPNYKNIKWMYEYFKKIGPVLRFKSDYQTIDLIPSGTTREHKNASLYLNGHPQFSSESYKYYHEIMHTAATQGLGYEPKKFLILGGGDGLIATEILRKNKPEKIDLVELDSKMIQLATWDVDLVRMNERALFSDKLKVHIQDAFQYLKNLKTSNENQYDIIFIDFPFPHGHDLLRLYSKEFYKLVKKALKPEGLIILDGPYVFNGDKDEYKAKPQQIIVSTLNSAGFKGVRIVGTIDTFYLAKLNIMPLKINYEEAHLMKPKSLVNYIDLTHELNDIQVGEKFVNTLFETKRIMWSN